MSKDMLKTIHEGCGGTFREWNIYEDIRCDKCRQGTKRYIRTLEEQFEMLKQENRELKDTITRLLDKVDNAKKVLNAYTKGTTTYK